MKKNNQIVQIAFSFCLTSKIYTTSCSFFEGCLKPENHIIPDVSYENATITNNAANMEDISRVKRETWAEISISAEEMRQLSVEADTNSIAAMERDSEMHFNRTRGGSTCYKKRLPEQASL